MRTDVIRLLLTSPVRSHNRSIMADNLDVAVGWAQQIERHFQSFNNRMGVERVRVFGSHLNLSKGTFDEGDFVHRQAIFKIEKAIAETCHGIIAYQPVDDSSEGVNKILDSCPEFEKFYLLGDKTISTPEIERLEIWMDLLREEVRNADSNYPEGE